MTELGLETGSCPRASFNCILSLKKEEEEDGIEEEEVRQSEIVLQERSTIRASCFNIFLKYLFI